MQDGVRQTFDSLADDYDQMGVPFFQPIAAELVEELAPQHGERALDVGCGRGAALVPLAVALGANGRLVGIDLSPRMVELAAATCLAADVRVGDAMAPDVDGPFDLVSASLVLFFLPDPVAALAAWRDLLVDGGRVGVSTFGPYSDDWSLVDEVLLPYRPPGGPDQRGQTKYNPFTTDEGVESLLTAAGFTDVRTARTLLPVRFDDAEHWLRWSRSQGQRRMWDAVPPDELADVEVRAMAAADATRRDDGRIGFDQVVRYTLGRR